MNLLWRWPASILQYPLQVVQQGVVKAQLHKLVVLVELRAAPGHSATSGDVVAEGALKPEFLASSRNSTILRPLRWVSF